MLSQPKKESDRLLSTQTQYGAISDDASLRDDASASAAAATASDGAALSFGLQYDEYTPVAETKEAQGKKESKRADRKEDVRIAITPKLSDIVKRGEKLQGQALEQHIRQNFNRSGKTAEDFISYSTVWGETVSPGEFMLVHLNQEPFLVPSSGKHGVVLNYIPTPWNSTVKLDKVPFTKNFYGAYGRYVLNVPAGHLAKAWSGDNQTPLLFGEGVHIIHDTNFKFNPSTGFVNLNTSPPHIEHGIYHILNIPQGKIAKVEIDNVPQLLDGRREPYVFITAQFKLIPAYHNRSDLFADASDRLIEHGPLKRVMPHTGQVATINEGGELKIITPSGKPTLITDSNTKVGPFINTNRRTLRLPTAETQAEKKHQGVPAHELPFDTFNTSDGARIGAKLLVVFEISDPKLALTQFQDEKEIIRHIENVAQTDMRSVIAQYSSDDLAISGRPKTKSTTSPEQKQAPSAPENPKEEATHALTTHLEECGIRLCMFNIEELENLNKTVSDQMAQQAVQTAQTNAELANIQKMQQIAAAKAKMDAEVKTTEQNQLLQVLRSKAQAELDAAQKIAEATKIKAQAEADALITKAKAEAEQYRVMAEARFNADKAQADLLAASPALLQLRLSECYFKSLERATIYLTGDPRPQAVAPGYAGMLPYSADQTRVSSAPFALYAQPTKPAGLDLLTPVPEVKGVGPAPQQSS